MSVAIVACDGKPLVLADDTRHLRTVGDDILPRSRLEFRKAEDPEGSHDGPIRIGDQVALWSPVVRQFVGVNFDDGSILTCWAPEVNEWETFAVLAGHSRGARQPNDEGSKLRFGTSIALSVVAKYKGDERWIVQYERNGEKHCRALVQHVGEWETFRVVAFPDE